MRAGGRPAEAVATRVQLRSAEQLFATLGELKGGAMKVGQALSAMEAALPEGLAGPYRDALVRLQEAAPAMPSAMVHAQLDASFPAGGAACSASSTTVRSPPPASDRSTAPSRPTGRLPL